MAKFALEINLQHAFIMEYMHKHILYIYISILYKINIYIMHNKIHKYICYINKYIII